MNFNVLTPETVEELRQNISDCQGNNFRFGAGYTDLLLELKKQPANDLLVINLAQLNDPAFNSITCTTEGTRIGALVTANNVVRNKEIRQNYPVLYKAALSHGSKQIRQTATVGGNLCTASPAGDMAAALVALQAECETLSADGEIRVIPINEFFLGVRKTDLKSDEILQSILIPSNVKSSELHSDFIKIGTRRSMECAVISLAYHFQTDADDKITNAGISIGSAAPTIKFCDSASDLLKGRVFNELNSKDAEEFAAKVLEHASPISDIRASAWYRNEVLFNISKSVFER